MGRPAIAVVTGYTRNPELLARSMAPLRALKQRGLLQRILAVTWDKSDIDAHVAPLATMPEVELVRVPEPKVSGSRYQNGVVFQVKNLETALRQVPDDDTLILKWRPDFVGDADFIGGKIADFDTLCAPSEFPLYEGTGLPPSPFQAKIWIPWADANQPFFYEDAAFLGLKRDVAKLVTPHIAEKLGPLVNKENTHGPFAHVVRFGSIFRQSYPIFQRYLLDYKYFNNDMAYRQVLVPALIKETYFLHLVVAHAWILAHCFHVDCGRDGQLQLFTNIFNEKADWSELSTLRNNPPFDKVEAWRGAIKPGTLVSGVARLYGRLMDDAWQTSLFQQASGSDVTHEQLFAMLKNVALYRKGRLEKAESAYYRTLADSHKRYFLGRAA